MKSATNTVQALTQNRKKPRSKAMYYHTEKTSKINFTKLRSSYIHDKLAIFVLTSMLFCPVMSAAQDYDKEISEGAGSYAFPGYGTSAYGGESKASGKYTTAIGSESLAEGESATAIGRSSKSLGFASTSLGTASNASANLSTAIGNRSSARHINSIAIGTTSETDRYNSLSVGGSTIKRQITNVAAGTTDTDAVNVKQLNNEITATKTALNSDINNAKDDAVSRSNVYTTEKHKESISYAERIAGQAEKNSNLYTDNSIKKLHYPTNERINQLDNKIDRVEKRANAGIAGVTALTSIPYTTHDNFSLGMGVGNYRNGNAIAVGMQYKLAANTNVRFNMALDNSSNASIGAGIAIGW